MKICGIDPGHKGGLALVDGKTGKLLAVCRIPLWKRKLKSGKIRPLEDPVALAQIFREWSPDRFYIEDVNGFNMAATSSFSFGRGLGVILGVAGAVSNTRPTLVAPQTWKNSMGLLGPKETGTTEKIHKARLKQLSIARAKTLFPAASREMDHDGCAEAALIATWGVLEFKGLRSDTDHM